MAFILRRLPFYRANTTLRILGPSGPVVPILHDQIVVWVSITIPGLPAVPAVAGRFPAVIDTAFNDSLLLQEARLSHWAGLAAADMTALGRLSVYGTTAIRYDADLWIHPNQPGFWDQFSGAQPFRVEPRTGISVSPVAGSPRLPLLGNLALNRGDLSLTIDYRRRQLSLREAR